MRARRILLAATVALGVVAAAPGQASACPIVSDPAGDVTPVASGSSTPADAAISVDDADILAGNAWSDGRRLHVLMRMKALPDDQAFPNEPSQKKRAYGYIWAFQLLTPDGIVDLEAIWTPDFVYRAQGYFEKYSVGDEQNGGGVPRTVTGVTGGPDLRKGIIELQVPLASIREFTTAKPGEKWTRPTVRTFIDYGAQPYPINVGYASVGNTGVVGEQADVATSKRVVVIGKPECMSTPATGRT